jgi:hypothetical protein
MSIGKLQSVNLRDLWKHEERGFSSWLDKNIDSLSEAVDISLTAVQREKAAGSFQVDLVAEDGDGNLVVIENQLEPTNHDHLGKLLTYLTNLEAKTAIWITSDARAEHIRTVGWLNEVTPADIAFYLVRLAAYRIGDSEPAPLFTVIVAPSPESKEIGQTKEALAERHKLRLKFWEQLLERAREKGFTLHANRTPSKENWISAGAGKAGLNFNYVIWLKDRTSVELYIDRGEKEKNKRIFDTLYSKKLDIEKEFGGPLQWERLDGKSASRIRAVIDKGGLKDGEEKWESAQNAMIEAMHRLSRTLKPYIEGLGD